MASREGLLGGARVERIGRERITTRGLADAAPIKHLDPVLVLTAFALTAIGALMIYSASFASLRDAGLSQTSLVVRQVTFAVAGLVTMILFAAVPYRRLRPWAPLVYIVSLFLLLAVLTPLGSRSLGAQRWINIGFFQMQPSELAKLSVIVALAAVLSAGKGEARVRHVVRCGLLVAPLAVLIYSQPDLGTLLVLLAVTLAMLLVSGLRLRLLLVLLVLGAVGFYGLLHLGLLKEYQVKRLTAFLDPTTDPARTGYNLNQAKIAIGSGGMHGKGLFSGTQTNLDFVPEQHTDFIFTVIGEEFGFIGGIIVIGLFAIFLWRGTRIAMMSNTLFGSLLAAGIVGMVAFQAFVNIGMTIGVSPITGIPLPFVSYGGSSLVTTYAATGVLLNIHMRRVAKDRW
ncbi:MAG: rod shape-determining protein RodA [Actinomycetota bacterium]|nr:rod shape-determining protein RodA [Actinomycetota bacterium]